MNQFKRGRTELIKGIEELMPRRVREILLVSTLYDSFILEEEGRFSDKLFSEYMELNLSSPPRLTRMSSGKQALSVLKRTNFDLVIVMTRVADMSLEDFASRAKVARPGLPIVMLAYDTASIANAAASPGWRHIDNAFIWKGGTRSLLALVKIVEDQLNVDHDTRRGMVRVIIVVEDSPEYYSAFLPLLYTELMEQTQSLIDDGLDHLDRLYRMRARPKVLLARTYEEGSDLFNKYRRYVLGIISDVKLPRQGVDDQKAGVALLRKIREIEPDLPLLLQSADPENRSDADTINVAFVDKNSSDLLLALREFIRNNFGFGDFVFRLADGTEVYRARNLDQMRDALAHVQPASLEYHARRNHISNWLLARGEFGLAFQLRARSRSEFKTIQDLRQYLLDAFDKFLDKKQRGRITDFSRGAHQLGRDFVRLGGGSMGGKGRSLAFLYTLLVKSELHDRYPDIHILVPRTTVICTDEFDRFIERRILREHAAKCDDNTEIADQFLRCRISNAVHKDLKSLLDEVRYPLAVRSSSLLEDSQFQPFAGVYATYMLPNNDPNAKVRLRQLRRAIKLVYASTYRTRAKAYMRAIGRRVEEEKMAVIIQRLIGTNFGERYYPTFAGVAQSYNYYPISHMKPDEGIAVVALGLGRTVVEGGKALRFSPHHPLILPQMSSTEDALRNSQRSFFAVDLSNPSVDIGADEEQTLVQPDLLVAEKDGSLEKLGATFDPQENRIYDNIYREGVRLVNFAQVLKYDCFPLPALLTNILDLCKDAMGCPIEIEFAVNLNVPKGKRPEFAILQVRPLVTHQFTSQTDISGIDPDRVMIRSQRALGNGLISGIQDIVFVPPERFDNQKTVEIAEEVATINASLVAQHLPYILIGPGRWGTADRFLGIPVKWTQVSAARIIVEVGMEGFNVDPSQGTHFFHNITSLRVAYLTIDPELKNEMIDWDWFYAQEKVTELEHVVHIRLHAPLEGRLDGTTGQGVVVRS